MIENLLKLGRPFGILVRGNQSRAAHMGRMQTAKKMIEVEAVHRQLIAWSGSQPLHGVCGLAPL